MKRSLVLSLVTFLGSCGLSGSPPGSGAAISIRDFAFSPEELDVAPGEVVTVENLDATPHSVTSQAADGRFVPGSVAGVAFDTGVFGRGTASFVVPEGAPRGTVVPYYCSVHLGMMRNGGRITVR